MSNNSKKPDRVISIDEAKIQNYLGEPVQGSMKQNIIKIKGSKNNSKFLYHLITTIFKQPSSLIST